MAGYLKKARPKKSALIVGRQPVAEALQSGRPIDKIFLQKNASGEIITAIREMANRQKIPLQYVPAEKLQALTSTHHQGVIALASVVRYYDLQEIISFVTEQGTVPLFLILDGITDVRNIGAIARTAVACGAQALIIPDKGVAALQEDAVKASAGALEQIFVCRVNSLMKAVDELHLNGICVYASEMTAQKKVFDCDFTIPAAFVMGSEDKGVFPALMKICDDTFRIPMPGDFESLNVSVAAGMILYEAMKQRMERSGN